MLPGQPLPRRRRDGIVYLDQHEPQDPARLFVVPYNLTMGTMHHRGEAAIVAAPPSQKSRRRLMHPEPLATHPLTRTMIMAASPTSPPARAS